MKRLIKATPGFYWVKDDEGDWAIAELDTIGCWWLIGSRCDWEASELGDIGPRIEPPSGANRAD